jgi:hypothetical protein
VSSAPGPADVVKRGHDTGHDQHTQRQPPQSPPSCRRREHWWSSSQPRGCRFARVCQGGPSASNRHLGGFSINSWCRVRYRRGDLRPRRSPVGVGAKNLPRIRVDVVGLSMAVVETRYEPTTEGIDDDHAPSQHVRRRCPQRGRSRPGRPSRRHNESAGGSMEPPHGTRFTSRTFGDRWACRRASQTSAI